MPRLPPSAPGKTWPLPSTARRGGRGRALVGDCRAGVERLDERVVAALLPHRVAERHLHLFLRDPGGNLDLVELLTSGKERRVPGQADGLIPDEVLGAARR